MAQKRLSRDTTTRAARTEAWAKRHQANADLCRIRGDEDGAGTYQYMANEGSAKAQELYKPTERGGAGQVINCGCDVPYMASWTGA